MHKDRKAKEQANAFVPLIGFIVLVILAVFAFLVSGSALRWVTTAHLTVGMFDVLPMSFPGDWPSFVPQLIVGFVIFLVLFVLAMIAILPFMGGSNPDEEFSKDARDYVREEYKRRTKRR
jgi:flagellar basal body-associated protein FliL